MGSVDLLQDVSNQLDQAFAGIGETSFDSLFHSEPLDLRLNIPQQDGQVNQSPGQASSNEEMEFIGFVTPNEMSATPLEPEPYNSEVPQELEIHKKEDNNPRLVKLRLDIHQEQKQTKPQSTQANAGEPTPPGTRHSSRTETALKRQQSTTVGPQSVPKIVMKRNGSKELISPVHPIPALQSEFEESILESLDPPSAKSKKYNLDAESRRKQLMELEDFSEEDPKRWSQKPGARFHPLRKLVAQISYGVYLLQKKNAKDEHAVVEILQGHVDEIDSFVDDTLADFDLAISDITERIEHLLLPLEHSRTFNRMLCDRPFRESIMDGNEIIEKIMKRTTMCMERSLKDVQEGVLATRDLAKYLDRIETEWSRQHRDLMNVYLAMKGNAQGWMQCFKNLQTRADELGKLMLRLGHIVDEVAKRCGIASRRKTPTGVLAQKAQSPPLDFRNRTSPPSQAGKPLPLPPMRSSIMVPGTSGPSSPSYGASSSGARRPQLSSVASMQTLDCLHRPPERSAFDPTRPSSSSSSPAFPPSRVVHFQPTPTSISPPARASASSPSHLEGRKQPLKHSPISPITPRSAMRNASSPTQTVPRPSFMHTSKQAPISAPARHDSLPIVTAQPSVNATRFMISPPPTGLGIETPLQMQHHPPLNISLERKLGYDAQPLRKPPMLRAPVSDPTPRPTSATTLPRSPLSPTFSIFPPSASPSRTARSSVVAPPVPTTPEMTEMAKREPRPKEPSETAVDHVEGMVRSEPRPAEMSDTIAHQDEGEIFEAEPGPVTRDLLQLPVNSAETVSAENTPHTLTASIAHDRQSSSSTLSEAPALSPSHATSSSFATVSTLSPRTPEDLSASGGLRSHPVSPNEFPQNRKSFLITALPKFTGLSASVSMTNLPLSATSLEGDHDIAELGSRKRPALLTKKSSMATMRTLFSKKNGANDIRLGSAGLGGCVALT